MVRHRRRHARRCRGTGETFPDEINVTVRNRRNRCVVQRWLQIAASINAVDIASVFATAVVSAVVVRRRERKTTPVVASG